MNSNQKEASKKKSLGELGELRAIKTLVDLEYDKIRNLNDVKMNQEFADIYCEKNGKKLIISVKARNKYQKNGKLNKRYNLGNKAHDKASNAEKEYDAKAYWMAIQFDEKDYSIYFGALEELGNANAIPVDMCEAGEIGEILVHKRKHYFDFEYFSNK